jgi:hypothetical protein
MKRLKKPLVQPSAGGNRRVVAAALALPAMLFLCGFMKPQLPETIYDGTRYSALIETCKLAYAHAGMTKMNTNKGSGSNGTYLSGRPCFPSFLRKHESSDLSLRRAAKGTGSSLDQPLWLLKSTSRG